MDEFSQRLQDALAPGYELERELGGGGMSRVFVATERALGRRVVVKVLSPELSAGVNAERFRREIQLAAQLHHPHIVPLLSAGEHGDLRYYTMPFIEGQSLRSTLRERGRLPVRDVVRMLHDVVDALAYAHARGIVHRDIKPDNILMHGAHALVTDFGVAKAISAALPLAGHTTTGMAIGTPAYMAPEQLAADPGADHRMDLYAVGLVAYELLTGGSPYSTTSPAELLAAQLTRTPAPLHEVVPEVPRALSAVIMSTLEKDPARRPATAEILLAHLDAVSTPQGGLISGASVPKAIAATAATTPPERASAARGFRVGALAAAIGIVAIIGVAFAAARILEGDREAPASVVVEPSSGSGAPVDSAQLRAPASATIPAAPNVPGGRVQPLVITREESLAIAAAVHQRMATERQQPGQGAAAQGAKAGAEALGIAAAALQAIPTAAFAESLRTEIHRVYVDSINRAMAELRLLAREQRVDPRVLDPAAPAMARVPSVGRHIAPVLPPPAPGVTRIVVTGMRGERRGPLAAATGLVTDTLRARLDRHPGWQVVDEPTMRRFEEIDNVVVLGFAARADVVVSTMLSVRRDSVTVKLTFIDPRSRAVRQVQSGPRPTAEVASLASGLATRTEAELLEALEAWQRQPSREPRLR